MEPEGAVRLFHRSIENPGLRYTEYLGDGDTSSFNRVKESKPYGAQCIISKKECIGHIQKRVGSRLRKLKTQYRGQTLNDGKLLSGKNRLNDKAIDTLQTYFGMAIRANTNKSLAEMQKAIMASFYHVVSTDERPEHSFCPIGPESWCDYQKDPENYKHRHGLPDAVVELLEPVYDELNDQALLGKCMHGMTQNPNECLNKCIWDRCQKEQWVSRKVVEQSCCSAVCHFNDGAASLIKTLERLGVKTGQFTVAGCKKIDQRRIDHSVRKMTDQVKARRKRIRAIKKGYTDKQNEIEGCVHAAGEFC